MKIVDIYLYEGEKGGGIQSPIKIAGATYIPMYRLIANEGMVLKNGEIEATVIDVKEEEKDLWAEVEKSAGEDAVSKEEIEAVELEVTNG